MFPSSGNSRTATFSGASAAECAGAPTSLAPTVPSGLGADTILSTPDTRQAAAVAAKAGLPPRAVSARSSRTAGMLPPSFSATAMSDEMTVCKEDVRMSHLIVSDRLECSLVTGTGGAIFKLPSERSFWRQCASSKKCCFRSSVKISSPSESYVTASTASTKRPEDDASTLQLRRSTSQTAAVPSWTAVEHSLNRDCMIAD